MLRAASTLSDTPEAPRSSVPDMQMSGTSLVAVPQSFPVPDVDQTRLGHRENGAHDPSQKSQLPAVAPESDPTQECE
jgi:hypothetical protein